MDQSDFALRINTGKFRAIASDEVTQRRETIRAIIQDEIKKDKEAPGGWLEFRKSWLFPILLSAITGLVGVWVGSHFIP